MVCYEWLHCLFSQKFQHVSNFKNCDMMTKLKTCRMCYEYCDVMIMIWV
jgi:hypothetical protein